MLLYEMPGACRGVESKEGFVRGQSYISRYTMLKLCANEGSGQGKKYKASQTKSGKKDKMR
jgi:hypothetical protein